MIDIPVWQSLLLMLPVVLVTALVSTCMRRVDLAQALRETLRLTVLITGGIMALSGLAFALHYLFCGGVAWF